MNETTDGAGSAVQRGQEQDRWAPGLSPGRIETLCDGVLAIAITILVLELPAPYLLGGTAAADHPASFQDLWAEFYIYAVSFISLGIYWILHHYIFHFIKRSDGVLVWLNVLFLMLAALVPYSAKVLMVNEAIIAGESETSAAGAFFGAITVATLLALLAMWQYATRGCRLVEHTIDQRTVRTLSRTMLIASIAMALAIGLSYLVAAVGFIPFVIMVYMIVTTARGRHAGSKSGIELDLGDRE